MVQELQLDWGLGVIVKPVEYIVSESNDLAASVGSGYSNGKEHVRYGNGTSNSILKRSAYNFVIFLAM